MQNSIERKKVFTCGSCGVLIPDRHVSMRRERGFDWITCGVCESRISLLEEQKQVANPETQISILQKMDQAADTQRDQDTADSAIQGKKATNDFDVFLCHNSNDKGLVKDVGEQLKDTGILPWLDVWELRPGFSWQRALEEQIDNVKAAAVFIGPNGIGPWQDRELEAFLREFVRRECPVIPILLEGCEEKPKLPLFLDGMTWVDFRQTEPNPLKQLIWGITGER